MKLNGPLDVPYRAAHLLAGLLEGLQAEELNGLWLLDDPGRPALVGTTARAVRISRDHGGVDEWDLADIERVAATPGHVRLHMSGGSDVGIPWRDPDSLDSFLAELDQTSATPDSGTAPPAPAPPAPAPPAPAPPVPVERMTTLASVPGHRVVRSLGAVSVIASASGWSAEHRGHEALAHAMTELGTSARQRGADAVVGLSASAFGARSSVSVLSGDAIGVVLLGTAVVLEPEPGHPEERGNAE